MRYHFMTGLSLQKASNTDSSLMGFHLDVDHGNQAAVRGSPFTRSSHPPCVVTSITQLQQTHFIVLPTPESTYITMNVFMHIPPPTIPPSSVKLRKNDV